MSITNKQIRSIASLAKLHLSSEAEEKYKDELNTVLEYFSSLAQIDTTHIEPTNQLTGLQNIFREDIVEQCPERTHQRLLKEVSLMKGRYIAVPKIFIKE